MALTVLEGMIEHSVTEEGDWYHSSMHDTAGFAPRALFNYGEALGREDMYVLAVSTADRYHAFALDVIRRWLEDEDAYDELGQVMAGAASVIDAYVWTGESEYLDFLSYYLLEIDDMIIHDPTLISPVGPFSMYGLFFTCGAFITLNAEVAMAIREVRGAYNATAESHLDYAAQILALLEDRLTEEGYYAIHEEGPISARENGNMLMGLATMYEATAETDYLDRALRMVTALEVLWDAEQGAYVLDEDAVYIGLAENSALVYAQLLLYPHVEDPVLAARAESFFRYVERELYRELPERVEHGRGPPGHEDIGGFHVMLHDNQGHYGEWHWCSGCNFFALHVIWLLNQVLGHAGPVEWDEHEADPAAGER